MCTVIYIILHYYKKYVFYTENITCKRYRSPPPPPPHLQIIRKIHIHATNDKNTDENVNNLMLALLSTFQPLTNSSHELSPSHVFMILPHYLLELLPFSDINFRVNAHQSNTQETLLSGHLYITSARWRRFLISYQNKVNYKYCGSLSKGTSVMQGWLAVTCTPITRP